MFLFSCLACFGNAGLTLPACPEISSPGTTTQEKIRSALRVPVPLDKKLTQKLGDPRSDAQTSLRIRMVHNST